jgi:hypothetical protein
MSGVVDKFMGERREDMLLFFKGPFQKDKVLNRFRAAIGLSIYWRGLMGLLFAVLTTLAIVVNSEYGGLASLELEIDALAAARWKAADRQQSQMTDRHLDLRPKEKYRLPWAEGGDGRLLLCQCFWHTNPVLEGFAQDYHLARWELSEELGILEEEGGGGGGGTANAATVVAATVFQVAATPVDAVDATVGTDYCTAVAGRGTPHACPASPDGARAHTVWQVRKTPSWPRSWANFSLLQLYSCRNAWANLHLLGQPHPFLAASGRGRWRRAPRTARRGMASRCRPRPVSSSARTRSTRWSCSWSTTSDRPRSSPSGSPWPRGRWLASSESSSHASSSTARRTSR